ncbi:myosin-4-like [Acanthaster planci]|uniref:Myosin-4-like n=1 Tax=Acanthaster planci TaxID=133434 RepID=A0A8B7XMM5_ACAPL|nr:myosin-4-like [Acanthaster planci]
MPLKALTSSPAKLCRGLRRTSDPNPGRKTQRRLKKSSFEKNFDEELLQFVHRSPANLSGEGTREARAPTPSLPYSKDFGSFDLTLCLAGDGRCVVLVEYEHRVFINGRQIYIQDSGMVVDRSGRPNAQFQGYYDRAIAAKKCLRGKGSRNGGKRRTRHARDISIQREEMTTSYDRDGGGNDQREMLERNCGVTFESELIELEAAFGRIIARLCKIILDVIGHETTDTESTDSDDLSDNGQRRDRLQTTLDRLSDQFHSVIELSSSLKAQHESAEAVQNMWLADDGACLLSGGDTTGQMERDTNEIDTVQDIACEKSLPHSCVYVPKPHQLWEENQALRKDIRTLEIELQQLELLHKKVEDQFFDAETERVDAQNQVAAFIAENEALKKQLDRMTSRIKGGKCDADSVSEGSATNLLSRFARKLSGSSRQTSPPKKAASPPCSSSDEHSNDVLKLEAAHFQNEKEPNVLKEFEALDRQHNLRSEMKRLRQVYRSMEEDMEKLGEENRSLRVRVMKMERERKEMKEKIRDTDSILEGRNREIEQLDSVNSKLDAKCALLTSEKASLGTELVRVNAVYAETSSRLKTLERELVELENKHKEAETEKQQCLDKLDLLNQSHLEECNRTTKLMKEKTSIEGQLSRLRREHGDVAAELDKLRVENAANAKGRLQAEKEAGRLELELQEAERSRTELAENLFHLRRNLAKSETNCKSLEREGGEMKNKCSKLEAEAAELRSKSEELYLGNRMLEEENSCLKEMNRELQRENAEMQDTVASLTDANAGIRAKMRQWNRDNISMENKMKKLIRAKAELHGVIRQLNTVHSDIESRFEKLDSEYADFESRLTKGAKAPTTSEEDQAAVLEEDIQREYEQLKKQLQDQAGQGKAGGEKLEGRRSKIEVQRRSSSKGVDNLKNEVAQLEKEILREAGNSGGLKGSPRLGNDVTFVSACSDLESEEPGLWWDDMGELNTSVISGNEDTTVRK